MELKDAQKQLESDTERTGLAQKRVSQLVDSGGKEQLGARCALRPLRGESYMDASPPPRLASATDIFRAVWIAVVCLPN